MYFWINQHFAMRLQLILLVFLFSRVMYSQCTTTLQGAPFAKILYVQNPAKADGSWCTDSIKLNGKPVAFEKAGAFELDISAFNIAPCDTMQLVFMHDCGCKPKLITEMHPPAGTTAFTSISIDSTGLLQWSVNFDCRGYAPEFQVIRLQWDSSWIVEKYVPQVMKPSAMYSCRMPLYPGENTFRIMAIPHYASNSATSAPVKITVNKAPITWQYDAAQNTITFSDTTRFRIVDEKGKVIQSLSNSKVFTLGKTKAKKRWMYFANNPEPVLLDFPKKRKTLALTLPM